MIYVHEHWLHNLSHSRCQNLNKLGSLIFTTSVCACVPDTCFTSFLGLVIHPSNGTSTA